MTEFGDPQPVAQLLTLGDVRSQREWPDYLALGLTLDHVPDLIRMTQDEGLHWADAGSAEVWAPIHAWRALATLGAEEAVPSLVALFDRIDVYDDDWVGEDLPKALGVLGPAAILELRDYLADAAHGLWARVAASASLAQIGQRHPEARPLCVAILAGQLEDFVQLDPTLNGFIINALVDLKAVEAASVMRRAFEAEQVDFSILGDWEDVQILLGLRQERRTPHPPFDWPDLSEPAPPTQAKREPRRADKKPGRNDPCWCGSGKKYKYCHLRADREKR